MELNKPENESKPKKEKTKLPLGARITTFVCGLVTVIVTIIGSILGSR